MKRIIVFLLAISIFNALFAQNEKNEILLTIGNRKISKSEFERIYHKNNNQSAQLDKKTVQEYLELFINFKLKVMEAESLKMDTVRSFIDELAGYRKQLAKPYLTDSKIDEDLLKEAYDRAQWDIQASHLLLKCDENASPEDTAKIYKKIMEIRGRIINGEDFNTLAKEFSEDPSAKNNGGDLGYFSVFSMVYPFENAAYNAKVGEVTMPVRTRFGYHLIKVTDRRPNQGEIKTAHIMVAVPKGTPNEELTKMRDKIFMLYDSLKAGKDFAKLAELYSDDKASARKGGELPPFGTGRMIPDFEKAAFALQNVGDYSEPIQTPFGWHLIKLLEKKPLGTFDEMKSKFKSQIARDQRAAKSKEVILAKLKNEYKFKADQKRIADFYSLADSSLFKGKWDASKAQKLSKKIFTLGEKTYFQKDFAKFLSTFRPPAKAIDFKEIINKAFSQYVDKCVIEYEDSRLEVKYPEFRDLMQEYHDGILLFELTDRLVWSKAVQDSAGLKDFYEQNKQNYQWGERFRGSVYFSRDEKTMKDLQKLLDTKTDKPLSLDEIVTKFTRDTVKMVTYITGTYSQSENEYVDFYIWNIGTHIKTDKEFILTRGDKLAPMLKNLDEAKGLVIADYQNYLEKQWIDQLRKKYTITINQEIVNSVQ